MVFVKVQKSKAYYKRYQVKFRRRREGKTDYRQRKRLCCQAKNKYQSPKYRFIVRFTNRQVICQIAYSLIDGDRILTSASSNELSRYGLGVGLKNYAAAYCTGLLCARRLLQKVGLDDVYEGNDEIDGNVVSTTVGKTTYYVDEVDEDKNPFRALLDVGCKTTSTGCRIFGALKGAADGGLDIPHSEKRFPGYDRDSKEYDADMHRERIFGGHVGEYMEYLEEEDNTKYQAQFASYIAAEIEADGLEELYEKVHEKIREDPSPTPKKAFSPDKNFKRRAKKTLEQRKAHMYEFQKDYSSALKIAKRQDASLVPEILVNQAKWHIDRKELAEAESCLLQSKNQDKAINVQLEKKMFNDALRLAKMQNIERVNEINGIITRGADNMNDDKLRNAALFEEQQEWRKAINCQLSLTEEDVTDLDKLAEYQDHALNLTMQFEKDKVNNVVIEVVKKLKKLNRHENAGDQQYNFGQHEQAIQSFMQAGAYEKAKQCVNYVKNPEQKEKFKSMIEEKMRKNFKSNNDVDQLVNSGDVIGGLDMLVKQGQQDQCLIIAQKNGIDVLSRYLFGLVNKLSQTKDYENGLKQLIDQDVPPVTKQFKFQRDYSLEIINSGDKKTQKPLKDMLRKLTSNIKNTGGSEKAIVEFERIQALALLMSNRSEAMEQKLYQVALKLAISVLRYINYINVDTAFYEAGQFAEKLKKTNWSFIFYQKFLDIVDAIEEQDPDQVNNDGLENTDIPQLNKIPLPKACNVSEEKVAAVRNQVLQFVSSESTSDLKLETRVDETTGSHIFEGSLRHPMSQTGGADECVISGFPVLKSGSGQCANCGRSYNKQDWSSYISIFNKCPNCQAIHKNLY